MKRLILAILLPLFLLAAAAPAVEAKIGARKAEKLYKKWKGRLESSKKSYFKAAGRYLYWKKTLKDERKHDAPREEIQKAKAKKAEFAKKEAKGWKKVSKAQRKVARYKKLMSQGRIDPGALRVVIPTLGAGSARSLAGTLGEAMKKYHITNSRRAAMFIAQIAHESGGLRYTREIWGPTAIQRTYAYRLGNHGMKDAYNYRGGGYIQITGRSNYAAASRGTGLPLLSNPNLLSKPKYAALASAWWWANHGLNGVADSGDFYRCTLIINGGTNGYASRLAYYARAKKVANRLVPR